MICTSVITCLSSGSAKSKINIFCHSESFFFRKWENEPYTKAVKQGVLVNFQRYNN